MHSRRWNKTAVLVPSQPELLQSSSGLLLERPGVLPICLGLGELPFLCPSWALWWGQTVLGKLHSLSRANTSQVPQVVRGIGSRSLGKVRHPSLFLFGVGGAAPSQYIPGASVHVSDVGTQMDTSLHCFGGGRCACAAGRKGWLGFIGCGVKVCH